MSEAQLKAWATQWLDWYWPTDDWGKHVESLARLLQAAHAAGTNSITEIR